jgi:hypothetical protein
MTWLKVHEFKELINEPHPNFETQVEEGLGFRV